MGKYKKDRHWGHKWRWGRVTKLMARDGMNCMLCGEELDRGIKDPFHDLYITFDHRLPRSAGGHSGLDNLQLAHNICNNLRGTDPLEEEHDLLRSYG